MKLFSFFKKKKKEKEPAVVQEVDVESVKEKIEECLVRLQETQGEEEIRLLNKLGVLYFEIDEYDQAISYYEESLTKSKSLGKAYTDLVKLYNIKRKEATDQNDKEKVQYYLQKSDELMQLTKDTIRGKF
jgi:tetratricopeptide (TPR) repeat protein